MLVVMMGGPDQSILIVHSELIVLIVDQEQYHRMKKGKCPRMKKGKCPHMKKGKCPHMKKVKKVKKMQLILILQSLDFACIIASLMAAIMRGMVFAMMGAQVHTLVGVKLEMIVMTVEKDF